MRGSRYRTRLDEVRSLVRGQGTSQRRGGEFTGSPPLDLILGGRGFPGNTGNLISQTDYDPAAAHYQLLGQQYDEPESWFDDLHFAPTSPERFGLPGRNRPLLTAQPDSENLTLPPSHPAYDDCVMTTELTEQLHEEAAAPTPALLDPELDSTQPVADQSAALEELAEAMEQQLQLPDPHAAMQELHDLQHELMMNPYMMPGIGPMPPGY